MMDKLALWRGVFYEGDTHAVRAITPLPVISPVTGDLIDQEITGPKIFREDGFDPVTRIRRGRLYEEEAGDPEWDQVTVDNRNTYNWKNLRPTRSFKSWVPESRTGSIIGSTIRIGSSDYMSTWRIISAEKITLGHVLLTLRANSLLGVIPELVDSALNNCGKPINSSPIKNQLDALVDAFHRQQPTPTVDVCRETAKIILTAWLGPQAAGKDLAQVISNIPNDWSIVRKAAHIVNRLHPRGKSAERERQAMGGRDLRPILNEDAETSVHLIGMILRDIGWAAP